MVPCRAKVLEPPVLREKYLYRPGETNGSLKVNSPFSMVLNGKAGADIHGPVSILRMVDNNSAEWIPDAALLIAAWALMVYCVWA